MKLSDIITVWDILHLKDTGEVGFCDLQDALETVVGVENDIPGCQPQLKGSKRKAFMDYAVRTARD